VDIGNIHTRGCIAEQLLYEGPYCMVVWLGDIIIFVDIETLHLYAISCSGIGAPPAWHLILQCQQRDRAVKTHV